MGENHQVFPHLKSIQLVRLVLYLVRHINVDNYVEKCYNQNTVNRFGVLMFCRDILNIVSEVNYMDAHIFAQEIISNINGFLDGSAEKLKSFLGEWLPKVTYEWREKYVGSAGENALQKADRESSADYLARLLKITDNAWFEIQAVSNLPSNGSDIIHKTAAVCRRWANRANALPEKQDIIRDLRTVLSFLNFFGGSGELSDGIEKLISKVGAPDTYLPTAAVCDSDSQDSSGKNRINLDMMRSYMAAYLITYPSSQILYSVNSGRVGFKPYQFRPVLKMLHSDKPRILIADSVGLGKTIEAGYIIKELEARKKIKRIAIICPKALVDAEKWKKEMRLFDEEFTHVNKREDLFRELGNDSHDKIIIPFSILESEDNVLKELIRLDESCDADNSENNNKPDKLHFDLVIVDEAHNVQNPQNILSKCVKIFCDHADAVVMLTATPFGTPAVTREDNALYTLLNILRGDKIKDKSAFEVLSAPNKYVNRAVHLIRTSDNWKSEVIRELEEMRKTAEGKAAFDADQSLYNKIMDRLINESFDGSKRGELISDLRKFVPNPHISNAVTLIENADKWQADAADEIDAAALELRQYCGSRVLAENPSLYDENKFRDISERLRNPSVSRGERVKLMSDIESLNGFNTMYSRTFKSDIQNFSVRRVFTVPVEFTWRQKMIHNMLLYTIENIMGLLHGEQSVSFMTATLQRQAASCIYGLSDGIEEIINKKNRQVNESLKEEKIDDDQCRMIDLYLKKLRAYINHIANLPRNECKAYCYAQELDERSKETDRDPKFSELCELILMKQDQAARSNNKIMIFSTFRHTLRYLKDKLTNLSEELPNLNEDLARRVKEFIGRGGRLNVGVIDGSVKGEDRADLIDRFNPETKNPDKIDILMLSEVGSEGLDFEFCDMLINYDLPWNPMRIEQRIGRIDRISELDRINKRIKTMAIFNIVTEGTLDAGIYSRLCYRIGVFERNIGDSEEILGKIEPALNNAIKTGRSNEEILKKNDEILDKNLTNKERSILSGKREDSMLREKQELEILKEEVNAPADLYLTDLTASNELHEALSSRLNGYLLERVVENGVKKIIGGKKCIFEENGSKTLRLTKQKRSGLSENLTELLGEKDAVKTEWYSYLINNTPNYNITFDPDTARRLQKGGVGHFFITAQHPLAIQSAKALSDDLLQRKPFYIHIRLRKTAGIDAGMPHYFSVYTQKRGGNEPYTELVTVCETSKRIEDELPFLLEYAADAGDIADIKEYEWNKLKARYAADFGEADPLINGVITIEEE